MKLPSVLIIESQPFFRTGLQLAVKSSGWLSVFPAVGDGNLTATEESKPAIILVDASRPRTIMDRIAALRRNHPEAWIVALTNFNSGDTTKGLVAAGANDCFPREQNPAELFALLQTLLAGKQTTPGIADGRLAATPRLG